MVGRAGTEQEVKESLMNTKSNAQTNMYAVERSITIHAPPETIFGRLENFHRWADWSPWEAIDPAMERTFSGPEAGERAAYAWKGNRKAGQGSMCITGAEVPHRLDIDIVFLKPFKANNTITFGLAPEGDATRVTWTMQGPKTLITKVMGLFVSMDKMVGKDFDKGLARLKALAES